MECYEDEDAEEDEELKELKAVRAHAWAENTELEPDEEELQEYGDGWFQHKWSGEWHYDDQANADAEERGGWHDGWGCDWAPDPEWQWGDQGDEQGDEAAETWQEEAVEAWHAEEAAEVWQGDEAAEAWQEEEAVEAWHGEEAVEAWREDGAVEALQGDEWHGDAQDVEHADVVHESPAEEDESQAEVDDGGDDWHEDGDEDEGWW